VVQSTLRFHKAESDIASFLKDTKIAPDLYYLIDLEALFSEGCPNVLPPINLKKVYGENSKDNCSASEYLSWCYQ
jgi:hypothetical protein